MTSSAIDDTRNKMAAAAVERSYYLYPNGSTRYVSEEDGVLGGGGGGGGMVDGGVGGIGGGVGEGVVLGGSAGVGYLNNVTSSFNLTGSNLSHPYDVPTGLICLLGFLYGIISLLAVLGNALVIVIIAKNRRMHTVTNIFIANLAVADVIIGMFSIPFQFQAALLQRWVLADFMCSLAPMVQVRECVFVYFLAPIL